LPHRRKLTNRRPTHIRQPRRCRPAGDPSARATRGQAVSPHPEVRATCPHRSRAPAYAGRDQPRKRTRRSTKRPRRTRSGRSRRHRNARTAYGSAAQWQITISANCDNLSPCGADNLGGFWLWAEFDNDGTADATITGCGHLQGGGGFAGAGHLNVDARSWTIAPGSAGPATFFITSETDTFVGHGTPQVVDIPSENMDTGVPAVPGHYTIAGQVFGFSGPGVTFQMQVVQIPGK